MSVVVGCSSWFPQGRGRRRAISRSNRRNRIATRKNRSEKGRRADPMGSNPHSYGESFSWSGVIMGSQNEMVARITHRTIAMEIIVSRRFIIFSWILAKAMCLEGTYTER